MFSIINSIGLSVAARTKQYGAFRAIGLTTRQLGNVIFELDCGREVPDSVGKVPDNVGKVPESAGEVPEKCRRVPEECRRSAGESGQF